MSASNGSQQIRELVQRVLGISVPDSRALNTVLIIHEDAHNDYDWTDTFDQYYQNPNTPGYSTDVKMVFDGSAPDSIQGAFQLLKQTSGETDSISQTSNLRQYHYAICEIAFLKKYYEDENTQFKDKQNAAALKNLRIVGGGMTSPSSLLPCGETFIRNYLVGIKWVKENLPNYSGDNPAYKVAYIWLSDSFALDPNLPAMVEAMGLKGLGFSRIGGAPGGCAWNDSDQKWQPTAGSPAANLVDNVGTDFYWLSPDGASTFAHWLIGFYAQNHTIRSPDPYKQQGIVNRHNYSLNVDALKFSCLANTQVPLKTGFAFVPVCDDMMLPCVDLLDIINEFNDDQDMRQQGVMAFLATFEQYAELVQLQQQVQLPQIPFVSTPEQDGFYASCPVIKTLHLAANNQLLAAEIFSCLNYQLNNGADQPLEAITQGWEALAPSTHHAYVTGLSVQSVYESEQILLLQQALGLAHSSIEDSLTGILAHIVVNPPADEQAIAVFNPLGFDRPSSLVEITGAAGFNSTSDGHYIQHNQNSQLFFVDNIPSLGYKTVNLSAKSVTPRLTPVTITTDGHEVEEPVSDLQANIVIISNGLMKVTLKKEHSWAIDSILDADGNSLTSDVCNQFLRYEELNPSGQFSGNAFGFLYEKDEGAEEELNLKPLSGTVVLNILEVGPLRVKLQSVMTVKDGHTITYTCEYSIVAGCSYMAIKATGDAADQSSVMVTFPLATNLPSQISYGSPYHWIENQPTQPSWSPYGKYKGPFFNGVFNFMIVAPDDSTPDQYQAAAAIYHKGVPAWAYNESDKTIYACLWRRVTMHGWSPASTNTCVGPSDNSGIITVEYAFRVPESLHNPKTGQPLREAMDYQSPLIARALNPHTYSPTAPTLRSYSLARTVSDNNQAIITAAKRGSYDPGNLIVRLYNPTNGALSIDVELQVEEMDGQILPAQNQAVAQVVTALEEPISPENKGKPQDPLLTLGNNRISFTATRSLTTLAVVTQK